jgi:DNA-binding transcriptional ArsR family regulator
MTASTDALDAAYAALADATRRAILSRLVAEPGATTGTLVDLAPTLTRWAVMKHLEVLRRAGLITTLPEGRRRRHYVDRRALRPMLGWLEEIASDEPPR